MIKQMDIQKILVIGADLEQANEFKMAAIKGCQTLTNLGYQVVYLSSIPIENDFNDNFSKVFVEPIEFNMVQKVIEAERPDAILPTLGGRIGIQVAKRLVDSKIFNKSKMELLGISTDTLTQMDDQFSFRKAMIQLNQPVLPAKVINNLSEGINFSKQVSYPILLRSLHSVVTSETGRYLNDEFELKNEIENSLQLSKTNQVLIERSAEKDREFELEGMRDKNGQMMIVSTLEHIDPLTIHSGDSIITTPTQTLSNQGYRKLKSATFKIMQKLKIWGSCNVKFSLDNNHDYHLLKINPRFAHASTLATQSTGFDIAKVSTKLALGMTLPEMSNLELSELDSVVTEIPNFSANTFNNTVGEVSGHLIKNGYNIEDSLFKLICSLPVSSDYLTGARYRTLTNDDLIDKLLLSPKDRLFIILELIRRDVLIDTIHQKTKINLFYLIKMENMVKIERALHVVH